MIFELRERVRAMAQFIFHVFAQFRKRLGESIRHKQRVITETVLSARLKKNFSFASTVRQLRIANGE